MPELITYLDKKVKSNIKPHPIIMHIMYEDEMYNNCYFVQCVFDSDKEWLLNEFKDFCELMNKECKCNWLVRVKKIKRFDKDLNRYYYLFGLLLSSRLGFHIAQYFSQSDMPIMFSLMRGDDDEITEIEQEE